LPLPVVFSTPKTRHFDRSCSRPCEQRSGEICFCASASVPFWECPKNKLEKSGMFLAPQKGSFPTTFYHAFHHSLTIKKPRSTSHFFQNTLKNTSKTAKSHTITSAEFF
jgi:hypothetical protein